MAYPNQPLDRTESPQLPYKRSESLPLLCDQAASPPLQCDRVASPLLQLDQGTSPLSLTRLLSAASPYGSHLSKIFQYTCPVDGFTSNPNNFKPKLNNFTPKSNDSMPNSNDPLCHPSLGLINTFTFRAIILKSHLPWEGKAERVVRYIKGGVNNVHDISYSLGVCDLTFPSFFVFLFPCTSWIPIMWIFG